jgi:hypothetical protein
MVMVMVVRMAVVVGMIVVVRMAVVAGMVMGMVVI